MLRRWLEPRLRRRGATMVEAAIVLMVLLSFVLGMIDSALAVLRYQGMAQAARQGARLAIVHGKLAGASGVWGPAAYTGTAGDMSDIAKVVRDSLPGVDASTVTIEVTWPDGDNDPLQDNRVTVAVSAPYHPFTTFIFGDWTYTLRASSTMLITH